GKGGVARQTFVLTVEDFDANGPPRILSTPHTIARVGETYRYHVLAADPNADPLHYSLERGPQGMLIDDAGLVQWTPRDRDSAIHAVEVRVGDGRGAFAVQRFDLEVLGPRQNR